jgi:hypothetical protein
MLESKIDQERPRAKLNGDGSANKSFVIASMNEMLLHALNGEPAEPVLFLPHDPARFQNGLPVKLTDLKVKDKTITLTVVPLTPDERKDLLQRVREPRPRPNPAVTESGGDGKRAGKPQPAVSTVDP